MKPNPLLRGWSTCLALVLLMCTGTASAASDQPPGPGPSAVAAATSPTYGNVPLTVGFDGRGSRAADAGDALIHAWDLDGDGQYDDSSLVTPSFDYTTSGTYTVRLKVTDQLGAFDISDPIIVGAGSPIPVTAYAAPSAALPAPWLNQDIGLVGASGSASYDAGVFTSSGSGWDIESVADEFHYVYQPLTGDGTIIARVTSLDNTDAWAKAGVMIRETLADNSMHAMTVITPGNGIAFQRRTTTGGTTDHSPGELVAAPYWVMLVRSGNDFSGYSSPDGVTWTLVGSSTIAMSTDAFVGLPVTSHNDGVLCTAVFDNVSVVGGADLSILMSAAPEPVGAGATLTYTIDVSNAGPSQADAISVTDTLPPGAVFESAVGAGWSCSGTGPVICTLPSLAIGAAAPISISVTTPSTEGPIVNTATVSSSTSDAAPANNSADVTSNVFARADLAITQSGAPGSVCSAQPITYTLNVSNGGPSDATSISVTDDIPAGASLVSATGSGWNCTGTTTVTCTRPTLAVGAAPSITVVVNAPSSPGTATNAASVASSTNDPSLLNNSSEASTTVNAIPPAPTASNNGPICAGATLQLSTPSVTGASYSWTGPNGFTSTQQNPQIPGATAAASGIYSVTVTVDGCTSNPGTTNATVYALPTAVVSGSAAICQGDSTQIQAALTGTAPWTLTWSDGFVQAGVAASPAVRTVNPSTTTTYVILALSDANCAGTDSGSAMITVNAPPTAAVSGSATICLGDSTQIQAALTGSAPWTLTWSDGFVQAGVAASPAVRSVSPASTTVYTVTALSDANCAGTDSGSAVVTVGTPVPTPALTAPLWAPVGATGLTASVPVHSGSTYSWTLTGGTITGGQGTAEIVFDAGAPGTTMTLEVTETNTSCVSPVASVKIQVDFLDVPPAHPFHDFVSTIARNGITVGCQDGTVYCPDDPNTRAEMAVFLLKSKFGSNHVPPPATGGVFADVNPGDFAADWIEELASLGITGGCGNGNYCPNAPVTRGEMAVFLLKTLLGSAYVPPPAALIFEDVPPGYFSIDWIEDLYNRQITAGCLAVPLRYCPDDPNTRGQMAVFLTKTFSLQ